MLSSNDKVSIPTATGGKKTIFTSMSSFNYTIPSRQYTTLSINRKVCRKKNFHRLTVIYLLELNLKL